MTFFSIIIPCYNSEATIERCINSVLSQTYTDFEIIVQDGRSKDNTIQIIQRLADQRITIYSEGDDGVYDAMNKAVNKAIGKWFYFLGSDDWLFDKHVLNSVFETIQSTSAEIVYGNVKLVGESIWWTSDIYKGETTYEELLEDNISHQAIFYRDKIFKSGRKYNTKYPMLADYDLNLYCAAKYEFSYTNIIIANYSVGGLSAQILDDTFFAEQWKNIVTYYGFKLTKKKFRHHKSKIKEAAKKFYLEGHHSRALKAFLIYVILKTKKF